MCSVVGPQAVVSARASSHHLSHTHNFVTHIFVAHTHNFVTHNFVTHHLSHTQLCHTHFCHTRTQLGHTHTHLCHTQLCHTHTQLCHTQLCQAHNLSHTTLSHTTVSHTTLHIQLLKWSSLHHLLCPFFFLRAASTTFSYCWKKLTCGVIRSFNFFKIKLFPLQFCGPRQKFSLRHIYSVSLQLKLAGATRRVPRDHGLSCVSTFSFLNVTTLQNERQVVRNPAARYGTEFLMVCLSFVIFIALLFWYVSVVLGFTHSKPPGPV